MQVPIKKEMNINSANLFKPTLDVSHKTSVMPLFNLSLLYQFKPKFTDQPLNPKIPEQIKKQVEMIKSNFNLNAPLFQPGPMQLNGQPIANSDQT